jgi:low-affinity ferrous iron transport protein
MANKVVTLLRLFLVPPKKGDITVRCHMANQYDSDSDASSTSTKLGDVELEKTYQVEKTTEVVEQKHSTWGPQWLRTVFQKNKQCQCTRDVDSFDYESEGDTDSPLDVFISYAVDVTGSVYMMGFVILILIAWIIWGAVTGGPDTWQIAMQDGQSIQTYVWDTFLMRQQMDADEKFLILSGKLKSRLEAHKRLIMKMQQENPTKGKMTPELAQKIVCLEKYEEKLIAEVDKTTWFDKISEFCAKGLGNIYSVIIYWLGVFAWVACGDIPANTGTASQPNMQKWSDNWQMYINTAVAIELLFTSVFLEHVRARSNKSIMKKAKIFNEMDIELERFERTTCHDNEENELIVVHRIPRDRIQKAISFYASVIGNGLGLIISACVFIAWFSIGDTMHWNSNWWLIIGTYTGLVGFIDGFVLREVYFSLSRHEHEEFVSLFEESQGLLDMIQLPVQLKTYEQKANISVKASLWINRVCSNKWSVIVSVITVVGLVIMASALRWSETAQLVCNSPTMIIEGFFLLMLIQAHNWADEERSNMVSELTKSRLYLHNYVEECFSKDWEKYQSGESDESECAECM